MTFEVEKLPHGSGFTFRYTLEDTKVVDPSIVTEVWIGAIGDGQVACLIRQTEQESTEEHEQQWYHRDEQPVRGHFGKAVTALQFNTAYTIDLEILVR